MELQPWPVLPEPETMDQALADFAMLTGALSTLQIWQEK